MLENQQLTLLSQRVRLDVQVEDVTLVADRGKIRLILENLCRTPSNIPQGRHDPSRARTAARNWCSMWPTAAPESQRRTAAHVFDAF